MYQCKLGLITAAVLLGLLVSTGVAETLPVWHSYDATIRTVGSGLIRGDIVDANTGIPAELKFYTSSDVLGVAEAADVPKTGAGLTGLHSNTASQASGPSANFGDDLYLIVDFSNHWRIPGGNGSLASNLGATEWFTPFVAKQLTARPNDGSQGDLPGGIGTAGEHDLAFHPPGLTGSAAEQHWKNSLGVIAFIAPVAGEYEITNFGARAIQTQGAASDGADQSVHIFDDGGTLLDSVAAGGLSGTRDITWKLSTKATPTILNLAAGEEIHFAVHATGTLAVGGANQEFWWDSTNVAFDITLVPEPSTFLLAAIGFLGVGLVGWRRRKRA